MTIQQFIEKAIEGGWIPTGYDTMVKFPVSARVENGYLELKPTDTEDGWQSKSTISIALFATEHYYRIFLDRDVWKAVGYKLGWFPKGYRIGSVVATRDEWHEKMLRMIDALTSGTTLEEFVSTL